MQSVPKKSSSLGATFFEPSTPVLCNVCAQLLSHVPLFVTPWTVALCGFPGKNAGVELSFPPSERKPKDRTHISVSPALAGRFFITEQCEATLVMIIQ